MIDDKLVKYDNAFSKYMSDISQFTLLTREEEIELSKTIRLSKNEKNREKAINELMTRNLRLVISLAAPCNKQILGSSNISFPDLVSAGNMGLRQAVLKFNSDLGYKFSTYAIRPIQHAIWAYIDTQINTVTTPRNHRYMIGKIIQRNRENEEVSTKELAKELNTNEKNLDNILTSAVNCNALSLDTVRRNDDKEETTFLDTMVDNTESGNTNKVIASNSLKEYLLSKLYTLTSQQHVVLFLHFFSYEPLKLEDISMEMGLTIERIRQILLSGIKKLKIKVSTELDIDCDNLPLNIKRSHAKKSNDDYNVTSSYNELQEVAETINEVIIGNNAYTISQYENNVQKLNLSNLGYRICQIIKNDVRLKAFFPKEIYKILKNKIEDKAILFNKYDYDFIEKNRFKGYRWLAQNMFCNINRLHKCGKRRDIKIKSKICFPEKEVNKSIS